jgi:hypothetical protein
MSRKLVQEFLANQRSNRFLNPEFILVDLAHDLLN